MTPTKYRILQQPIRLTTTTLEIDLPSFRDGNIKRVAFKTGKQVGGLDILGAIHTYYSIYTYYANHTNSLLPKVNGDIIVTGVFLQPDGSFSITYTEEIGRTSYMIDIRPLPRLPREWLIPPVTV